MGRHGPDAQRAPFSWGDYVQEYVQGRFTCRSWVGRTRREASGARSERPAVIDEAGGSGESCRGGE